MAETIDNLELAKRKLFRNLDPDQFSELQDYYKTFSGIEPVNVNKAITADDVLRATGPLSQVPTSPGLTGSVVQFNQFLGNILGAKSQRIADEKTKQFELDQSVRDAVLAGLDRPDPEINPPRTEIVDGVLYTESEFGKGDFEAKTTKAPPVPQTVNGVPRDIFDSQSQENKNIILGIDSTKGETFLELYETKDGLEYLYLDANNKIQVGNLDAEPPVKDDKGMDRYDLLQEKTELLQKQNSPEGLTEDEATRLEVIPLELDRKQYEPKADILWAEESQNLILDRPNRERVITEVARVYNLLNQEETRTGILTPGFTFVQEVLEPFGVDLKGITDAVGLEVLNPVEDSALIDSISQKLGIEASKQLAGQISQMELIALFNTTLRLGKPKEFNKNFAQGLLYLAEKSLYASTAAETASNVQEWAQMMRKYQEDKPPPYFMQPIYDFESLADLNLDLNLRQPLQE